MTEIACIAVFAWVFTNVLMDEDMILFKWRTFVETLPEWLGKPLGLCEYCLGGQIALWYYLFTYFGDYNFLVHLVYITGVIFLIRVTNKLIYGV